MRMNPTDQRSDKLEHSRPGVRGDRTRDVVFLLALCGFFALAVVAALKEQPLDRCALLTMPATECGK